MIFRRSLVREIVGVSAAALLVLIGISFVTQFIKMLGRSARGEVANEAVLTLLGFGILNILPVLLSLAVFIGVILALNRAFKDSEMAIWFSSGLSLAAFVRPVLHVAVPVAAIIALLSFALIPWSAQQRDIYRKTLESRDDAIAIIPGVFAESKHGDKVYFVENYTGLGGQVKNVFIQSIEAGVRSIVVAASGRNITLPDGERYLVLEQGRRYEGVPGERAYRMGEFKAYWMRLESAEFDLGESSSKTRTTAKLLADPTPENQAEWVWRMGLPISALLLAIAAVPLSVVNPRGGRSLNLLFALLVFVIYNNFLSVNQAWVAQGEMPASLGLVAVHAVMALVIGALFYARRVMR
jgi:lipopolysaccharide export system permease protein